MLYEIAGVLLPFTFISPLRIAVLYAILYFLRYCHLTHVATMVRSSGQRTYACSVLRRRLFTPLALYGLSWCLVACVCSCGSVGRFFVVFCLSAFCFVCPLTVCVWFLTDCFRVLPALVCFL